MQFYSAIIKNEIMLFASKWMELEIIMLSQVSQAKKIQCVPSLVEARSTS
jgi:hypothetical protein